ncbi:hypothetical protein CYMTET_35877 [Cymbomonas tetramitiformis]|uniref:Uncharacterized protein n=1 Tax=Cymbomonas tetramitiformis TaxID=36881 RepID=A0AAE0F8A9_9CHLO|nr:hypothetical protein CYMTET_35877 [Cymbomonas tetramitiformis]
MFDICRRLLLNGLPNVDGVFKGHTLGTDNAYTSEKLAVWGKLNNLNVLGTVQLNRCDGRVKSAPAEGGKATWESVITVGEARGDFASATAVNDGVNLVLTGYTDNKLVHFLSNYHASPSAANGDTVARWDKGKKEYVQVFRPALKKV